MYWANCDERCLHNEKPYLSVQAYEKANSSFLKSKYKEFQKLQGTA